MPNSTLPFDWFGGLKWFTNLAKADKALALIVVLIVGIGLTSWGAISIYKGSQTKDEKHEARTDSLQGARIKYLENLVNNLSLKNSELTADNARLNVAVLDQALNFTNDLKEQRDRLQKINTSRGISLKVSDSVSKQNEIKLNQLKAQKQNEN